MALNIDQQINFLKKIDFFENFDDHELRQFLAVTKWLKVPADTLIIKENTIERIFYVLVKGEVSVFKTVDEGRRSLELTTLKSGACFGEMSLVMDVKRTAGVTTRCDSFLLMVEPGIINTSNVFLQLKFYKRFCEILVSRLILANERMVSADAPAPMKSMPQTVIPEVEVKATLPSPPASAGESVVWPGQQEATVTSLLDLPNLPEKKDRIVKKSLHRQIAAAMELPFNPVVADRLSPLLRGECENTLLLADLLQLDPVLSLRVMQVANSSYYRRSMPVATVPHAMITVGIKHLQETLTQVINGRRRKPFAGFKPVARAFWRHSILVARIAVLLRDVIRLSLTTDIYLAGLFHDIGILALDAIEPHFYPHLMDQGSELCANLCAAEISYIGIDHGQAGAVLAESIGLPETYLDVMRFHHDPTQARASELSVALVHLANIFANMHGGGLSPVMADLLPPPLETYAWAIIQEHHRPFCEVNVADFVRTFDDELTSTWSSITDGLTF